MSLKATLQADMKDAMRARDSARLGVIRMLLAAIKQIEVDERRELDDPALLGVLEKQVKQRKESIRQFTEAAREDLADKERAELEVLAAYLPKQLSDSELDGLIGELIAQTGAASVKDMGKVMGKLKERAQGRVDMAQAGARIRARLQD